MSSIGLQKCVVCSCSEGGSIGNTGPMVDISNNDSAVGGGRCGSSILSHDHFSRFCGELQMCSSMEGGGQVFLAVEFLRSLVRLSDELFVCAECLALISAAMKRKCQLEELECQLLKLQLDILMKVRELQQCTDAYYRDMTEVLEKTRNAELLENNEGVRPCDVVLFREKIFDVVTHLGMFLLDIDKKFAAQSESVKKPTKESFPLLEKATVLNAESDYHEIRASSTSPPPASPPSAEFFSPNNSDNDEGNKGMFDGSMSLDRHDEPLPDNDSINSNPKNVNLTRLRARSKNKTHQQNQVFGNVKTRRSERKKPDKLTEPAIQVELKNDGDDNSDKDSTQEDGVVPSDSDEEYAPSPPPVKTRKRNREGNKTKRIRKKQVKKKTGKSNVLSVYLSSSFRESQVNKKGETVDFSGMGIYKEKLVRRITKRNHYVHKLFTASSKVATEEPEDDVQEPENLHPELRNLEMVICKDKWSYSPFTDKFTVSGISFEMNEDSSSSAGTSVGLGCNACNFRHCQFFPKDANFFEVKSLLDTLQKHIFNHVFHTHLKAFKCPYCPDQEECTHADLEKFKQHVMNHENPGMKACNICLLKCHQLSLHKRMYHHSESAHYKKPKDPITCATCGKIFQHLYQHNQHIKWHTPYKEKPRIVCPFCGARILKSSFRRHKLIGCHAIPKRKPDPVMCSLCGKTFTNSCYIKQHMIRMHERYNESLEKQFVCNLCGAAFVFKQDLRYHESRIHQLKKKEHECGKGCGRKFVTMTNQFKHERICNGGQMKS